MLLLYFCFKKSDLEGNPFHVDEENEETAELESVLERLQARDHNEALVRLAKDSGRKLFCHLDADKRRNRISSMVRAVELVGTCKVHLKNLEFRYVNDVFVFASVKQNRRLCQG